MRIYVVSLSGVRWDFDVSGDDTVASLKQKIQDTIDIIKADFYLTYSGKQMTDERDLKYYRIGENATVHMVLITIAKTRFQKDDMIDTSPMPTAVDNPSLFEQPQNSRKIRRQTQRPVHRAVADPKLLFDDDECLLSPETYYEKLDSREMTVMESSEYFKTAGRFNNDAIKSADGMYASSHCSLEVWRCLDRYFARKASFDPTASPDTVLSLGKSYMVLCNILNMLEDLDIDLVTVLIFRSTGIAEMVEVPRDLVADLHDAIGDTILGIMFRDGQPKSHRLTVTTLVDTLLPALQIFMAKLCIENPALLQSCNLLHLCRTLVLFLDLGLVLYMGSHGTGFDLDYLGEEQREIVVDLGDSVGFKCSLQRLACLDEFVGSQEVWTFQLLWNVERDSFAAPLSILTTFRALAETWGPIWLVSAGNDHSDYYKQINIGTGRIVRVTQDAPCPIEGAVSCHWLPGSPLPRYCIVELQESALIPKTQKLLIGANFLPALGINPKCTYSLYDLERDYGLCMSPLGTMAGSWAYDERQVGFTASQYIGISVMGTQKKVPCITQKRSVWNTWTNQPSRANPHVLNLYLGVEISHCTGNARRVKLRDVIAMKQVQSLLERQFPDWKEKDFGLDLRSALLSSSDHAIVDVWLKHHKSRTHMAELVCCVLELLDKTGMSASGFGAALLNGQRELSMPVQTRLNRWVAFLEDSHLTAVYAIVNDACLIHKEYDPTTDCIALCNSENPISGTPKGFTVLQTQLTVPHATITKEKLVLNQRGLLQRISRTHDGVHMATWESSKTREFGSRLGHLLRSKQPSALSRELQDAEELGGEHVQILVKSTTPSHGGLPEKRNTKCQEPVQLQNRDSSQPIRIGSSMDDNESCDTLVMLQVGGDQQRQGVAGC
ncbi:hypothetical protein ONS96_006300 [Cadophora gregata f. sp. sojae]|nr:hypothetical protein ONS96_006300 [Cadophora gregata f. sp. sojae]